MKPNQPDRPRQAGQATRRSLLTLLGLGAAAGGGWWAWRRHAAAPANTASATDPALPSGSAPAGGAANAAGGQAPTNSATAAYPAPATAPASAPVAQGDTLTAAFWQQHFERPATGPSLVMAAYQGAPLVINFWATWCPPCVKELPELVRFQQAFAAQGWHVVALAVDGPTPVRAFLAKVGVPLPVGLAGFNGTELAKVLGNEVDGLPFSVIVDAQGRIRHRKSGATSFKELSAWAREITPA